MAKKLSMFLSAVLVLGLLAGSVLNGNEFKNSKDSDPSSISSAITSTKPVSDQRLPKTSDNHSGSNVNSAEAKKHMEDTLKMLVELENVYNSLDTVHDQDLITPSLKRRCFYEKNFVVHSYC